MNIYDIAKEAGVSISTVSKVINNRKGIKESTRQMVKSILDKYNYMPNPIARLQQFNLLRNMSSKVYFS